MIIRRHTQRPATGLWNRIRRRRWEHVVEVVGAYPIKHMRMSRGMNAPDDVEVMFRARPRDMLALLADEPLDRGIAPRDDVADDYRYLPG